MNAPDPAPLILTLFLPCFIAFWLFVVWLISRVTGWNRLAQSFRATSRPTGPTYPWRSLHGNFFSRYNNCINATLASEGLYLVPMFMFRVGHPPLLIPWHYIEGPDTVGLLLKRLRLRICAAGATFDLYLPPSAAPEIRR